MQVDMHAAKSQLSRLGELVAGRADREGGQAVDLVPHRGPERTINSPNGVQAFEGR